MEWDEWFCRRCGLGAWGGRPASGLCRRCAMAAWDAHVASLPPPKRRRR